MINDTAHQIKPRLNDKWQAFFRKNRERNAAVDFPGLRHTRAPKRKVRA